MSLLILGVLNYTPDSFSDGGRYKTPREAVDHFEKLLDTGADFVDVGCESTRPGAEPVDAVTEWERLEPLLVALDQKGLLPLTSLDTRSDLVARKCLKTSVRFFNNVEGLYRDETLRAIASESQASYIAMHMHGVPQTMQEKPLSGETAVLEVNQFFRDATERLLQYGFTKDRLWLDPGIGFGKDDQANFALLRESRKLSECYNVCIGISRKGFLGRLFRLENPLERDSVSKALELGLWFAGAGMIRTHAPELLDRVRKLIT